MADLLTTMNADKKNQKTSFLGVYATTAQPETTREIRARPEFVSDIFKHEKEHTFVPPREKIVEAFLNLDESATCQLVESTLDAGVKPIDILEDCRRGMLAIGERFERGEFFLSEMIMAAEIFKQVTEQIRPHLSGSASETKGKVVIGTVEGDNHDIGKNIFIALLEVEGFAVLDLGVDVPPEKFVEAIREHNPHIIGMSCLLSTSIEAMKSTVDAITEAGLRDKTRIIIGGGRLERHAADYIKPDAYTDNAAQGVKLCVELLRGREID